MGENNNVGQTTYAPNGSALLSAPQKRYEVLDPGHRYAVKPMEYGNDIELIFVKKNFKRDKPNGKLETEHDGLTSEAVIEVLISRLYFLQSMNPCVENVQAIEGLHISLSALERRTRNREIRKVEGTNRA